VSAVNGRAPLGDGMLTTIDATVIEPISGGGYKPGQQLRLRLPMGLDGPRTAHDTVFGAFGDRSAQLIGRRVLLFVVQDLYAEQARARGGKPVEGHIGGTLFYHLEFERLVNNTDSPAPETLTELRRLTAGSQR
jgi:hypothetical protein